MARPPAGGGFVFFSFFGGGWNFFGTLVGLWQRGLHPQRDGGPFCRCVRHLGGTLGGLAGAIIDLAAVQD